LASIAYILQYSPYVFAAQHMVLVEVYFAVLGQKNK